MADDLKALVRRVQTLEDLEAVRRTWCDDCRRLYADDWTGLADVTGPWRR